MPIMRTASGGKKGNARQPTRNLDYRSWGAKDGVGVPPNWSPGFERTRTKKTRGDLESSHRGLDKTIRKREVLRSSGGVKKLRQFQRTIGFVDRVPRFARFLT
jgi:hypothetical protein